MRIDSKRLVRLSGWFVIFAATTATAQTYRQTVSGEYVVAPDRSFTYTVHSETTPLTQSVLVSPEVIAAPPAELDAAWGTRNLRANVSVSAKKHTN